MCTEISEPGPYPSATSLRILLAFHCVLILFLVFSLSGHLCLTNRIIL